MASRTSRDATTVLAEHVGHDPGEGRLAVGAVAEMDRQDVFELLADEGEAGETLDESAHVGVGQDLIEERGELVGDGIGDELDSGLHRQVVAWIVGSEFILGQIHGAVGDVQQPGVRVEHFVVDGDTGDAGGDLEGGGAALGRLGPFDVTQQRLQLVP
jgi:hypothetical protein